MKKVEFRRNHTASSRGSMMSRRGVVLIIVLFFLFFLSISYWASGTKKAQKSVVSVRIINDSLFLVNKDTTNYDEFASVLLSTVKDKSAEELKLYLPKNKTVGQLNDLIQICSAIDGVSLKMIAEK